MCDTMVRVTADGTLFAKNSDRDANEPQLLEWHPRRAFEPGATIKATYLTIEQVARTYAVVLSRPWWMFGAEMGANEFGVVIGNEAVYTREPLGETALLGMDMVRLALERAANAREAVEVLVGLLERYGQGGDCSIERPGWSYHNSFLVADPRGAVVLETAGSAWATEEITSGARAISNGLTIPRFAHTYADKMKGRLVGCSVRRRRAEALTGAADGALDLMAALRSHGTRDQPHWNLANGTLNAPCVHAGGLIKSSQTTSSLVADLRNNQLFATGTAAPCTSIFKPIAAGADMDLPIDATNRFDERFLWWRHEVLHRHIMRDYAAGESRIAPERDAFERSAVAGEIPLESAFDSAEALETKWRRDVTTDHQDRRPSFVRRLWRELDESAALPRVS